MGECIGLKEKEREMKNFRFKMTAKVLSVLLILVLGTLALAGCGGGSGSNSDGGSGDTATLNFAYQYGLQYLPGKVVQEQKLIEKYYDGDVKVNWQTLNSGAAINEALVAGSVDAGIMGSPVAVTGVNSGVPAKIFTGISNIGNRMITKNDKLKSLKDFKEDDKIALVNIGSVQHITLAMAAKELLGDAHALDGNIVGMAHPDGMAALTGNSVAAHFTTIPYWGKELEEAGTHEITEAAEYSAPGASIIVAVASTELSESNPKLFEAMQKAFEEAMTYVNDEANFEAIAESMYEDEGVTKEKLIEYLNSDDVKFDANVTGLMEFATFMGDEQFIDGEASTNEDDYIYEGVTLKPLGE
jgi:NitT/TauT family transport system substrate-binding protein